MEYAFHEVAEVPPLVWKEEYAQLNKSQRAIIAAKWLIERKEMCRARMRLFRLSFEPGAPQPCSVCDKYLSVSHAHHIYPLVWQVEDGRADPLHEYRWLCPTHHSGIHRKLAALKRNEQPDLAGFSAEEKDRMDKITLRYVEVRYGTKN